MRTEQEVRDKLAKLSKEVDELPYWEDDKQYGEMICSALQWVLGNGELLTPSEWEEKYGEEE